MTLETLVVKYPKIFKNRYSSMQTTAMCWGFECGEGWFNLLDRCCYLIQQHIDNTRRSRLYAIRFNRALKRAIEGDEEPLFRFHLGPKKTLADWAEQQVIRDLETQDFMKVPEACPQVVAVQVKEKFGGLRFYYDGGDDYVSGVTSMAETMSYSTCEVCGDRGFLNRSGWCSVRCVSHQVKDS